MWRSLAVVNPDVCEHKLHMCRTLITLLFSSFETVLLKAVSVLQRGTCVIHSCLEFHCGLSVFLLLMSLIIVVVDLWSSGRSCIWRSSHQDTDCRTESCCSDGNTGEINSRWVSMSCGCCFIHQTRPSLTHSYSLHSFFSVCLLHRSFFISSLISSSCIYGSRCSERRYKAK